MKTLIKPLKFFDSSVIVLLTLVLSWPSSAISQPPQKPYIISGFDDVLRQAENTGLFKAALKILEEDRNFTGMPELYKIMSSQETHLTKFSLVSAISHWFDDRIEKFLKKNQYPTHDSYLRNWLIEWSIQNFKISKVSHIISEHPGKKFIVVFDNSDASLVLAQDLKAKFPDEIQDIYLRQVVKKELPAGATSFISAFDIALHEFKKNQLSHDEIIAVANAILNEKDAENIIPSYAYCPKNYHPCPQHMKSLQNVCNGMKLKITELCKKR